MQMKKRLRLTLEKTKYKHFEIVAMAANPDSGQPQGKIILNKLILFNFPSNFITFIIIFSKSS